MKKYVFRRYSHEYEKFFKLEKERLKKVLNNFTKIKHVGSTNVQGLGGKGILDILIGVPKNNIEESKNLLKKADYDFCEKASTFERLFFKKDYSHKNKKRRIHIHLTKFNSKDWKDIISFCDYLKRHSEVVEEYIKIKKDAVRKARGDGEIYRKHKEKFIKDIMKKIMEK